MFTAGKDKCIIGADYSRQEVLLAACFSHDTNMLESFKQGLDIYSYCASLVYDVPYEECLEFHADGTVNKEGKARRKSCKAIILGINYSKGVKSIASDLNISIEKAQEIKDMVFTSFPQLKQCIDNTIDFLHKNGYVENMYGLRRRLPDVFLPKYEFEFKVPLDDKAKKYYTDLYTKKLDKTFSKDENTQIIYEAKNKGIEIKQNGAFIAKAEREAFNACIQSAASIVTKRAILNIFNNKRLQELDAHIILSVHDENLIVCPKENAYEVSKIMRKCSIDAGIGLDVPLSLDMEISESWCGQPLVFDDNHKLIKEK